jgi:hypothetical protein
MGAAANVAKAVQTKSILRIVFSGSTKNPD